MNHAASAVGAVSLATVAAAIVAGCALQQPPTPEPTRAQALGDMDLQKPWRAGDGTPTPVADNWLATFGDPQLDALVAEAVERNPDLRVAAARVEQATEYLRIAQSSLKPTVDLRGTGGFKLSDM